MFTLLLVSARLIVFIDVKYMKRGPYYSLNFGLKKNAILKLMAFDMLTNKMLNFFEIEITDKLNGLVQSV